MKRTHLELKEEGWNEWIKLHSAEVLTDGLKTLIRTAYDYGWYNAYGLKSEDIRHNQIMKEIKLLSKLGLVKK